MSTLSRFFGSGNNDGVSPFDQIRHQDEHGDFWWGRELGETLGYARWEAFRAVIEKTLEQGAAYGIDQSQWIRLTTKSSDPGYRGGIRNIDDFRLNRRGCYHVTLEADSSKPIVAAAKNYFVIRTRQAELAEEALRKQGPIVRGGAWEARIMRQHATHVQLVTRWAPGYWTVLMQTYPFLLESELTLMLHELPTLASDLMDGSIGKRWANLRERETGRRNSHRHPNIWVEVGDEMRRTEVLLWPDEDYARFKKYLLRDYFPNHLVEYLRNKDSMKRCNPIALASAANHISLDYTGQAASLSEESMAILEQFRDYTAKNGFKRVTHSMAQGLIYNQE